MRVAGHLTIAEDDEVGQFETIDTLKSRHAQLEGQLDEELRRPVPDQAALNKIKREKLRIKDQIAQMERV